MILRQVTHLTKLLKKYSNGDVEISLTLLSILMMVAGNKNVTYLSDIIQELGITNSSISHHIYRLSTGERSRYNRDGKQLVKQGLELIEVTVDRDDYRKKVVTLTDRGRELIKQIEEI